MKGGELFEEIEVRTGGGLEGVESLQSGLEAEGLKMCTTDR